MGAATSSWLITFHMRRMFTAASVTMSVLVGAYATIFALGPARPWATEEMSETLMLSSWKICVMYALDELTLEPS